MADDMAEHERENEPPSLTAIVEEFKKQLEKPSDQCEWEKTINYFGHIELYRLEVIDRAKETIEKGEVEGRVREMLGMLCDELWVYKRRKDYLAILLNLCRDHIKFCTCSEEEYLVPSLLKKYFPSIDATPAWAPHIKLSMIERTIFPREKEEIMKYLREVNEWEESLEEEEEDSRRELYLKRFGEPFERRQMGGPSLREVALVFADKVENNANALERILNALN